MSKLHYVLSEISVLAKDLNYERNTLGSLIFEVERVLRELNVGIEVWLPKQNQNPITLGYCQLGASWRLSVLTPNLPIPLADCKTETRVRMVEQIPDLLALLLKRGRETTALLQEANKSLGTLSDLLGNGGSGR